MPIINQVVKGGGGSAPAHYIEKTVDGNGKLINSTNIINLNGVTDVGDYVLAFAYYQTSFPANTSIDLSGLTAIRGDYACEYMFQGCTGLTSADISDLTAISGSYACEYMFQDCTGLTSVDLSSLTILNNSRVMIGMFKGCTGLISADLPSLTTVSGDYACTAMFSGCTSLATVYIGGTTAIDFGTRTNQFNNMFKGCTQNIDVYAPAANQAQIEAFEGYPNFGGTGTVTWHWRS
jgi:hypothetical protein